AVVTGRGEAMIRRRQWEAGGNPQVMFDSASSWAKNPGRKRALYLAALVRQFWDELPWICRMTTELCERRADGEFNESSLRRPLEYIAEGAMLCAQFWLDGDRGWYSRRGVEDYECYLLDIGLEKPHGIDREVETLDRERLHDLTSLAYSVTIGGPLHPPRPDFHCVPLLRDVFGNPFRRITSKPDWRT